jgi:GNAT superfamily N-acetyltransferase
VAFTIRLLTSDDAAAFKAFRLQSLRDAPDAFHSLPDEWDLPLETIAQRIEANRIYGAFDADQGFVGIAMLALTARPIRQMRHKAEVWAVYVDPSARGHGMARRLMETCIAEARRMGFEALILTASTHLTHVVALYESLGFVVYGTERGMVKLASDGRYIDDHLMELRL